jgi:hypothetical protein
MNNYITEKVRELLTTLRYCFDDHEELDEVSAGNQLTSALLSAMQERDRQVIEMTKGMEKGGWGSRVTAEQLQYNYGYNKALEDVKDLLQAKSQHHE